MAFGFSGVDTARSKMVEAALIDSTPVESRRCPLRLNGSREVNGRISEHTRQQILGSGADRDTFYQKLQDLLRRYGQSDLAILGDTNAIIGPLSSNEVHLSGPFGLDSCGSGRAERLLGLCSDR